MFAAFRVRRPLSHAMKRRVWLTATALGVATLLFWESGRSGRGEFDPMTLAIRSRPERTFFFGSVSVPLGPWEVRGPKSEPLLAYLLAAGKVAPLSERPTRWDLHFHWSEHWRDGYGTLYRTLHRDASQWIAWSVANPERARVWWDRAFALLRSDDRVERDMGETMLAWPHPNEFVPSYAAEKPWDTEALDDYLEVMRAEYETW